MPDNPRQPCRGRAPAATVDSALLSPAPEDTDPTASARSCPTVRGSRAVMDAVTKPPAASRRSQLDAAQPCPEDTDTTVSVRSCPAIRGSRAVVDGCRALSVHGRLSAAQPSPDAPGPTFESCQTALGHVRRILMPTGAPHRTLRLRMTGRNGGMPLVPARPPTRMWRSGSRKRRPARAGVRWSSAGGRRACGDRPACRQSSCECSGRRRVRGEGSRDLSDIRRRSREKRRSASQWCPQQPMPGGLRQGRSSQGLSRGAGTDPQGEDAGGCGDCCGTTGTERVAPAAGAAATGAASSVPTAPGLRPDR
ncbi:hypothetical protein HNR21_001020 [Actinomadura cellulosilytica]|uniref:Uncharacterized protein n=1 Tax=Thermomonospora cellulosilytica TaxID=1411118 RepID=A0A7W3MUG6_9ACTN|nr:hypothetical protein [Thermomonospora cellulosilytica]